MIRKIGIFFLLLLGFWAAARFSHHKTCGFRLSKIENNTSYLLSEYSSEPQEAPDSFLSQKFHYLDRGLQSFSFLGEDKKTVLKIFNNRYQRRLRYLRYIPGLSFFKKWKEQKIAYNEEKLRRAFKSYQITQNLLQNRAGILYLHLQKSPSSPREVVIVDKLGILHRIDLSRFAFALQKKATLAYPYLTQCAQNQEWKKAKKAINSLVQLYQKEMSLGIKDKDPLVRTNVGFLDDVCMQIDIGPFSLDPGLKDPMRQREEIPKMLLSLKHWLEQNQPKMIPYFNEAISNL